MLLRLQLLKKYCTSILMRHPELYRMVFKVSGYLEINVLSDPTLVLFLGTYGNISHPSNKVC